MTNPDVPPILTYLPQLAEANSTLPVDSVLQQLANFYDADGIGVTSLTGFLPDRVWYADPTKKPETLPWRGDAGFVNRLRTILAAEAHQNGSGEWLIGLAWEPRDGEAHGVWLHRTTPQGWREADRKLWPIVAQTLVRWLALHAEPTASAARLRRSLEETALVTSRLSHDFGNYLTGIMGFTELSLAQAPSDGLLHAYLQEVLQSARQGAAWIRRLHWFCRRNEQLSWPSDLASALEEAGNHATEGPAPRWEVNLPADLPLLAVDALSLQTVLSELAQNAADARKEQCVLSVAARSLDLSESASRSLLGTTQPGAYVEITLADNGPGFTPDARARVFQEPYFSTKPRHRGVGLLVVYGILQRFRGGLRIEEAEGGKGACVRLYLPAVPIEVTVPTGDEAPHLLLVHPDPLFYESLRKILERQGYRVTVANSSQMALSLYQTAGQAFALVLAEALLPQLSAFDLARRILDREPKARFVFLHTRPAFHGLAEEELLKRFTLLRWPLEISAFQQAVRTALAPKGSIQ